MNSVIVLCVGLVGAANPAHQIAESPVPVQVAFAGSNFAAGGCYQQPTYRSPVVQRGPSSYSTASCNCPPGLCATGRCGTSCSNGQCSPVNYTAGTATNCANGQCTPQSYSSFAAGSVSNCPDGKCNLNAATYTGGKCYGPNCPQQNRGSYYPATNYNRVPATRYPVGSYTQPRRNRYSNGGTYNVNWTNTYRPVQPSNYSTPNTNSPFFN